jgi:hypothetical protein
MPNTHIVIVKAKPEAIRVRARGWIASPDGINEGTVTNLVFTNKLLHIWEY